jgi:hypothetical protein
MIVSATARSRAARDLETVIERRIESWERARYYRMQVCCVAAAFALCLVTFAVEYLGVFLDWRRKPC